MLQRFINTNGIVYPMKYFPRVKDHDPCFPSASELLRSESPAGPFSLLSPLLSSLSSHPDSVASITKAGHASRPAVECRRNEVFHPPSFPSPPGGERNREGCGGDRFLPSFVSGSCPEEDPFGRRRGKGGGGGRTFKLGRESRGIRERNRRGGAGIP